MIEVQSRTSCEDLIKELNKQNIKLGTDLSLTQDSLNKAKFLLEKKTKK